MKHLLSFATCAVFATASAQSFSSFHNFYAILGPDAKSVYLEGAKSYYAIDEETKWNSARIMYPSNIKSIDIATGNSQDLSEGNVTLYTDDALSFGQSFKPFFRFIVSGQKSFPLTTDAAAKYYFNIYRSTYREHDKSMHMLLNGHYAYIIPYVSGKNSGVNIMEYDPVSKSSKKIGYYEFHSKFKNDCKSCEAPYPSSFQVSPDGKYFTNGENLYPMGGKNDRYYGIDDDKPHAVPSFERVYRFTHDGRGLIVGTERGVGLYDPASGKIVKEVGIPAYVSPNRDTEEYPEDYKVTTDTGMLYLMQWDSNNFGSYVQDVSDDLSTFLFMGDNTLTVAYTDGRPAKKVGDASLPDQAVHDEVAAIRRFIAVELPIRIRKKITADAEYKRIMDEQDEQDRIFYAKLDQQKAAMAAIRKAGGCPHCHGTGVLSSSYTTVTVTNGARTVEYDGNGNGKTIYEAANNHTVNNNTLSMTCPYCGGSGAAGN